MSLSHSPTPTPRSPSSWSDFLVLDCQANLHIAMGTPIEAHVALPVLRFIANEFADRVRERAACVKGTKCPALSDVDVETFIVPSIAMALDSLREPSKRAHLPASCMASTTTNDGLPAFASSFWSDASVVALLGSDVLNSFVGYSSFFSRTLHAPAYLQLPSSCSYDSWVAGKPCMVTVDASAVSGSKVQVAIGHCPAPAGTPAGARGDSALPSISISCSGAWCANLLAPCTNVGSTAECGGSGPAGTVPLVCRSLALASMGPVTDGGFESFLSWLKLIPGPQYLLNCASGALSGIEAFAFSLRTQLALLTGRAPPTPTSPQVLAFCAPTDDDVLNILQPWALDQLGAVENLPQTDLTGCAASGCDVVTIGDGRCNIECHTAACKWDGNDCGGAGRTIPPVVDSSLLKSNTVQWADAIAANLPPAQLALINFWEPCNGWYTPYPESPCSCTPLPNNTMPCGASCMYCPPPAVTNPYPAFVPYAAHLSGVERFIMAWDGQLPNGGGLALSDDRISGAAWAARTPTVLPPSGASVPTGFESMLQVSCTGDISFAPLNRNLGIAFSMPLLQRGVTWAATWVQQMQTCFAKTLGVTPLSSAQFELRWMPHHLATWAYQYLSMNNAGAFAASGAQTLLRKVGAAMAVSVGFGDRSMETPWMYSAEPVGDVSDDDLLFSQWAYQSRIRAPNAATCSFESVSPLGSAQAATTRACSASWSGADSLLASPAGTVGLYGEVAQDVCAGTVLPPTGGATQSPTNLGDGFPSFALWIKAAGTAMLRTPTPCSANADCTGFGPGAICLDINSFLSNTGGLKAALPGRLQDALSWFVSGSYSAATSAAQSTCSNADALLASAHAAVLSAAEGYSTAAPTPAPSTSLSYCFFDVKGAIDRATAWKNLAVTDCSRGNSGRCLDWPAQQISPASLAYFDSLPAGVRLAPDASRGAFNPAAADAPRSITAAGPTIHFTATLPGVASLTQGALDAIRRALADAISHLGFTVAPGGVTVAAVAASSSSATALTFEVTLVDATQQAQLLTQLGSTGALGGSLGPVLAGLGALSSATAAAGVPVSGVGAGASGASPSPTPPGGDSSSSSLPAIIGGSVGAVCALAAVVGVLLVRRGAFKRLSGGVDSQALLNKRGGGFTELTPVKNAAYDAEAYRAM